LSSRSNENRVLNVPFVAQGNYNLCWAASAVSKGRYISNLNLLMTPQFMATRLGIPFNAGATIEQTNQGLQTMNLIGSTTARNFAPSQMDIINKIGGRGRPMIIAFHASLAQMGHAVLFNGFHSSTQGVIFNYMDPNFGFATTFSQGTITIVSGGVVMRASAHIN